MDGVSVHIIHEQSGMLSKRRLRHIPRVGDEIRLPGDRYFTVKRLVWPLDEDCERVNIGVVDAAPIVKEN